MTQYIALLRAINVAGHGIAKMEDVRDAFAKAGCRNVTTCIQSGNVIFEAPPRDTRALIAAARRRLKRLLGEEPEIMLRSVRDVASLVDRTPFTAYPMTPRVKLYVAFLARAPRRRVTFPLVSAKDALEAIGLRGPHAFIVSRLKPNGFFGFPNNFIETALGVPATSRNWSTVTKIVEMTRVTRA